MDRLRSRGHEGRQAVVGVLGQTQSTLGAMISPASTRPSLLLRVAPMVLFSLAMILSISTDEEFDWRTVVTIVLWAITIGLLAWSGFGPQRKDAEPDS
jgi:hypothetical protein